MAKNPVKQAKVDLSTLDWIKNRVEELDMDGQSYLASDFNAVANAFEKKLLRIHQLEDMLFEKGVMAKSPCFCCGYSGHGYFSADVHPCAERHERLYKRKKS